MASDTTGQQPETIDWPTVESAVRRGVSEYSRAHLIPANDLAGAVPEAMRKLAENWGSLIAPYVTACIREDLRKARLAAESGQDTARACCDLHNAHCEPPSELCCHGCTEAQHPQHPPGVRCVLESGQDGDSGG